MVQIYAILVVVVIFNVMYVLSRKNWNIVGMDWIIRNKALIFLSVFSFAAIALSSSVGDHSTQLFQGYIYDRFDYITLSIEVMKHNFKYIDDAIQQLKGHGALSAFVIDPLLPNVGYVYQRIGVNLLYPIFFFPVHDQLYFYSSGFVAFIRLMQFFSIVVFLLAVKPNRPGLVIVIALCIIFSYWFVYAKDFDGWSFQSALPMVIYVVTLLYRGKIQRCQWELSLAVACLFAFYPEGAAWWLIGIIASLLLSRIRCFMFDLKMLWNNALWPEARKKHPWHSQPPEWKGKYPMISGYFWLCLRRLRFFVLSRFMELSIQKSSACILILGYIALGIALSVLINPFGIPHMYNQIRGLKPNICSFNWDHIKMTVDLLSPYQLSIEQQLALLRKGLGAILFNPRYFVNYIYAALGVYFVTRIHYLLLLGALGAFLYCLRDFIYRGVNSAHSGVKFIIILSVVYTVYHLVPLAIGSPLAYAHSACYAFCLTTVFFGAFLLACWERPLLRYIIAIPCCLMYIGFGVASSISLYQNDYENFSEHYEFSRDFPIFPEFDGKVRKYIDFNFHEVDQMAEACSNVYLDITEKFMEKNMEMALLNKNISYASSHGTYWTSLSLLGPILVKPNAIRAQFDCEINDIAAPDGKRTYQLINKRYQ